MSSSSSNKFPVLEVRRSSRDASSARSACDGRIAVANNAMKRKFGVSGDMEASRPTYLGVGTIRYRESMSPPDSDGYGSSGHGLPYRVTRSKLYVLMLHHEEFMATTLVLELTSSRTSLSCSSSAFCSFPITRPSSCSSSPFCVTVKSTRVTCADTIFGGHMLRCWGIRNRRLVRLVPHGTSDLRGFRTQRR